MERSSKPRLLRPLLTTTTTTTTTTAAAAAAATTTAALTTTATTAVAIYSLITDTTIVRHIRRYSEYNI